MSGGYDRLRRRGVCHADVEYIDWLVVVQDTNVLLLLGAAETCRRRL